ncbi:Serine/threonine protein kinase [Trema orientale]|uniref:Serine/threonine protein kinase n=1 Tax=Trema orientale TaxID=63057 RepID=A0A2P5FRJ7_TREOI|nr:Serine/threonine protein kinase [Trema orientale]
MSKRPTDPNPSRQGKTRSIRGTFGPGNGIEIGSCRIKLEDRDAGQTHSGPPLLESHISIFDSVRLSFYQVVPANRNPTKPFKLELTLYPGGAVSLMGRNVSNHSISPVKGRGSPHRKSPSRRERSPTRHRSSHRGGSPAREKHRSDAKSPKHRRSASPNPRSRSPSPRTKRLRRTQAEREAGKVNEKEPDRNHGRGSDRGLTKEGGLEKETGSERKDRRSGRDDPDGKSSRSRQGYATSPSERHQRSRHRSHSPQPDADTKNHEGERVNERDYERNNGRGSNRAMQKETDQEREMESMRTERKSGRDDTDHKSSRSKHGRSTSPSNRYRRNKHRSQSPQPAADTRARDEVPTSRGSGERNDEDDSVSRMKAAEEALAAKQKDKPSFELSGKLAAETNRVRGVTLLFNEPPDARKPDVRWRLYVFKNGEPLNEPLYIHRQSCYLFGRERRVADVPTDHPSCSKQHAVIQFRQVEREKPDGMLSKQVRPYVMDLGSTNKTFINDVAIEPQRYYELHEKDTIKFGNSSREYVLLHENSAE